MSRNEKENAHEVTIKMEWLNKKGERAFSQLQYCEVIHAFFYSWYC